MATNTPTNVPTNVPVSVTVADDGQGPYVLADPENLDLTKVTGPVKITWTVNTQGYHFLHHDDHRTYGVDFTTPGAHDNFKGWTALLKNGQGDPISVSCSDPNHDGATYSYTIVLRNTATGAKVRSDPTIKDNSN